MTLLWATSASTGPSDVTAPTITSVTASAGTYYFVGRTLTLTANFDEEVTVTGTPRIALTIGAATRYATYASGSGTTTLTFTYTFVVGDTDTDGFAATSPIELNSGTIKDAAGNDATLTFSAPDMSAKRAVLRGVTWATDFELRSVPDLEGKLSGTLIDSAVGVQGSTINSDTNDPFWIPDTGVRYDGNDYFSSVPYAGGKSDYLDSTTTWSFHRREYIGVGQHVVLFNSADAGMSSGMGSWALVYGGIGAWVYWVNANNISAGSGNGGYRCTGAWSGADHGYFTISIVSSAAGAGGIKVYIDGVLYGTITGATAVAVQTDPTIVTIGYSPNAGPIHTGVNNISRAQAFCNVAHTDAEVMANHLHLASLPNAA